MKQKVAPVGLASFLFLRRLVKASQKVTPGANFLDDLEKSSLPWQAIQARRLLATRTYLPGKNLTLGFYEDQCETLQGDGADSGQGTGHCGRSKRHLGEPGCVVDMDAKGRAPRPFHLQGMPGPVPNTVDTTTARTYSANDRPAVTRLVASADGLPGTWANARPVPEGTPARGRERPTAQALRALLALSLAPGLVPRQPGPAICRAVWRH
jgi:hypothetical protein